MNLPKAIEILQDCTHGALLGISQETKDALQLGSEAVKELRELRLTQIWGEWETLPGETEE